MSKELTPFEAVGAVGNAVTSLVDVYKEARINRKFDKIYMATALQHYREVLRITSESQLVGMRVKAMGEMFRLSLNEIRQTTEMLQGMNPNDIGYRMGMEQLEILNRQLQRLLTNFHDTY